MSVHTSRRRFAPRLEPKPAPFVVHDGGPLRAPGAWLIALEARALFEAAAMFAAMPWLARLPPDDGHPVLVFPGLGASDITTAPLRHFLRSRGYQPHAWRQGFNLGPRHGLLDACQARVRQIARQHGQKVSLIGWSLGSICAREIAKAQPEHARCVITLGTPFAGHPRATNAWRFYKLVSGQSARAPELVAQIRQPPTCPTTSIYSKSDGVVAWRCGLNDDHAHTENIEVRASHVGIGMNPVALYAIADRLAQQPQQSSRFDARGAQRWFFKVNAHATAPS